MISYIMNFKKLLKSIKPAEILVLVVFVLYLVFPVTTPSAAAPYIESPLGLVVLFGVAVALFVYSHPSIAILFVFVAYTLLRRSTVIVNKSHYLEQTKSETEKRFDVQKQVQDATPKEDPRSVEIAANQPVTLEEEIVMERAPIGRSDPVQFLQSSYKPVASNTEGTSGF